MKCGKPLTHCSPRTAIFKKEKARKALFEENKALFEEKKSTFLGFLSYIFWFGIKSYFYDFSDYGQNVIYFCIYSTI